MTLVFASVAFILPVKIIGWIAFESVFKAFFCLNQLQLVCNYFQNKYDL